MILKTAIAIDWSETCVLKTRVRSWKRAGRKQWPGLGRLLRLKGRSPEISDHKSLGLREIKVDQAWLKGERRPQMILQRKSDQIRVNPTYRTDARQSARSPLGFATVGTFLVMPAGRLEQKRLLTEISDCYKCPRTGLGFHDLNLGQMPPCTLPSR